MPEVNERWGHIDEKKSIASPRRTVDQLAGMITHAKANLYPIAINLEMYEDGSVLPESAELLKEVNRNLERLADVPTRD